jgi:MFS family permease
LEESEVRDIYYLPIGFIFQTRSKPCMHQAKVSKHILPIIVFSQFCCTSLWFAGNGVMDELVNTLQLQESALAHLTSAVQFGFIVGTLLFAFLTIADRFAPSKVFLVCAILGSAFNAGLIWEGNHLYSLLALRFFTGFFLAGIYPVGMKIAADYYDKGLGKSLGYLVGALVVGTAFPHLFKGAFMGLSWKYTLLCTSGLALLGGLLMYVGVPDGPYRRPSAQFDLTAIFKVFKNGNFRAAAFGYFGHMWELYAFWAFVPVILMIYKDIHPEVVLQVPIFSFIIIAVGGVGCVIGGYASLKVGAKKVAAFTLLASGICCVLSPLLFYAGASILMVIFLIIWGMVVVTDSPQFSTLVAQNAPVEYKGTALTIVNCIGFAITIFSIQLLDVLKDVMNPAYIFVFLAIGPILGLLALLSNKETKD